MKPEENKNKRYTYADCISWTEGYRCEIIHGVAQELPPVYTAHAKVCTNLSGLLFSLIEMNDCKCNVYAGIFDVRLPKNGEVAYDKIDTVVQPDICVICDQSKLDDLGCCGAPDMIVEILSPLTCRKDIVEKFTLYEEFGVKEYWVVFPNDKAVTVFLLQPDGKYSEGTTYEIIYGAKKVPVKTLEGLVIDLEELFEL